MLSVAHSNSGKHLKAYTLQAKTDCQEHIDCGAMPSQSLTIWRQIVL